MIADFVEGRLKSLTPRTMVFNQQSTILRPQSTNCIPAARIFESRAWLMLQHEVKHEQGRNKEKHCQG